MAIDEEILWYGLGLGGKPGYGEGLDLGGGGGRTTDWACFTHHLNARNITTVLVRARIAGAMICPHEMLVISGLIRQFSGYIVKIISQVVGPSGRRPKSV